MAEPLKRGAPFAVAAIPAGGRVRRPGFPGERRAHNVKDRRRKTSNVLARKCTRRRPFRFDVNSIEIRKSWYLLKWILLIPTGTVGIYKAGT